MAAPTQGVLDNFNRANGGLGTNWSTGLYAGSAGLSITSNQVTGSAGDYRENYYNVATYTESEAYVTINTLPGTGNFVYLWARAQAPNTSGADAYELIYTQQSGTDTIVVNRVINQAGTLLATINQDLIAGDRIGLVVLGTGATVTIQVWRYTGGAWTQLGSNISDTNAARITTAGYIGLGIYGNTARVDEFGGGEQTQTFTGTGTLTLPVLTMSGVGTSTAPSTTVTGSGNLVLPSLTITGAGTMTPPTFTGSGDLQLPALTITGIGTASGATFTGTGALILPALTLDGVGATTPPIFTGSGNLQLPSLTIAGTGAHTPPVFTGSGTLVLPALTMSGTGVSIPDGGHLRFYGTASGQIDRVRIPLRSGGSPTAVDVGAGDFTYEFWLRALYADNATSGIADVRYSNIVLDRDAWNSPRGHVIGVTRRSGVLVACFGVAGSGLTWTTQYGSRNVGDGQPHHIALVRRQSTGVMELYVDGVLDASGTYTTGDLSYDGSNAGGQDNDAIILGTEKHDVGAGFAGRLDSLRISNNRRYTGTFTPTRSLSADVNTVGLYQCDDAAGTILTDDASGVHGALLIGGANNGPTWQTPDLAPYTGSGTLTLPALTLSGVGDYTAPANVFTGSGDLALPALTIAGSGTHTAPVFTGSGDLVLPGLAIAGVGGAQAPVFTGSGDLTLPALTASGAGTHTVPVFTGSGDLALPALTMAGVGTHTPPTFTGSGDLVLPALTMSGSGNAGTAVFTGSGVLVLPALTMAGVGTYSEPAYVPTSLTGRARIGALSATARTTSLSAIARITTLTLEDG